MMKYLLLLFLLIPVFCFGANREGWHEKDYQKVFCDGMGGKIEYRLSDGARVDCLTDDYAIEVDFCKKWAESVGQSFYYAIMTDKEPGILLICEPDEFRFINRLLGATFRQGVRMWVTEK